MKNLLAKVGGFFTNPSPKTLSLLWLVPIITGAIPTLVFMYARSYKPYGLVDHLAAALLWTSLTTILLMIVLTIAKFVTLLCRRAPGAAFKNLGCGVLMFILGGIVFACITQFFW